VLSSYLRFVLGESHIDVQRHTWRKTATVGHLARAKQGRWAFVPAKDVVLSCKELFSIVRFIENSNAAAATK
jgi:hypothetical protein